MRCTPTPATRTRRWRWAPCRAWSERWPWSFAPIGVRANAVLVGPLAVAADGQDPELLERTLLRSPSGRCVTAREAAAAIAFVAGPGAAFMTGTSLRVDGGWASLNQAPDGMRFR